MLLLFVVVAVVRRLFVRCLFCLVLCVVLVVDAAVRVVMVLHFVLFAVVSACSC